MIIETLERYWAKVEKHGPDDCWIWTGAATIRGYGQIASGTTKRRRAKRALATHIALAIDGRFRPSDEHVAMHGCDNPRCVNPRHLSWGSIEENMADMHRKGRSPAQIRAYLRAERQAVEGTTGRSRKLSPEAVTLIRNSKKRVSRLAEELGVGKSTIYNIRARKAYADVP